MACVAHFQCVIFDFFVVGFAHTNNIMSNNLLIKSFLYRCTYCCIYYFWYSLLIRSLHINRTTVVPLWKKVIANHLFIRYFALCKVVVNGDNYVCLFCFLFLVCFKLTFHCSAHLQFGVEAVLFVDVCYFLHSRSWFSVVVVVVASSASFC
jgi:hypothetical protein